ncbi:Protein of unknown function (DUF1644 [Striga hermonthica]|uniref:Uncharacterized protein n=1 Tax=Striga hermonthica TaxID=68872 RepID=A0A9N7MXA5_STRHE|nr:Protein of unknown function (DUF1644 [Striga hermonthica]
MDSRKRSIASNDNADDKSKSSVHKEWDEASCPICMDHPHNAVLLICTSHDKGCRSYICDTSYRHSNCLDRFKKPTAGQTSTDEKVGLQCPLCRGSVLEWKVVEEARKYLNLKPRACSRESCSFSGNYRELRGHARRVHPAARPADVDPSRQRAWRRLEDQREYNDIVSAISSAVPGAVVVGDYMIEGGGEHGRGRAGEGGARWLSTLVLFQMIGSLDGGEGRGGRSRNRRAGGRAAGSERRRYLWGENLLGIRADEEDEDDEDEDDEDEEEEEVDLNVLSDIGPPRRRRRLMQDRSSDDDDEVDMGF